MSARAVVCVATGRYQAGQQRLYNWLYRNEPQTIWRGYTASNWPPNSPLHSEKPYAFKAHAMWDAVERGAEVILWTDASILPIRSLEPLWERIERDGCWISNNGWLNSEWTADSAYPDLFPDFFPPIGLVEEPRLHWKMVNEKIPHVVATAFGLDVRSYKGAMILNEYLRLAQTDAFKGPWWNSNHPEYANRAGAAPCGDSTVRGHRHDQTALSVIAWRMGCELTNAPEIFAYRGGETEQTILVADGSY